MDLNGDARIRFDDFEFDPRSGRLLRNGQPVRIQPQPLRVLRLLLERPGQTVTREELREHIWGDATYVEFDQGLNYCIRQIRLALGDNAASPTYVETLPKQGYRFLPAVVHADGNGIAGIVTMPANGSLRLPNEKLSNEDLANQPQPLEAPRSLSRIGTKRAWWFVAAGLCALLIIASASMYLARKPRITSLAVLPLDNLSPNPSQDYFADGMTDELTTMLAKNSTLRIVSRTSVMQYKRTHSPLPEIARRLGVDAILEGSVAHSNTGVHMTIQLIDARTDWHLWAESFDRDTSGSVSLPREVAQAVARKLRSAVPETTSTRYVRPEAHDAYLHGRYLWFRGRNDQAEQYFRTATTLQPDYALGWAGLANVAAQRSGGERNPKDCLPSARAFALKAVALDPSLAEAHLSLCRAALVDLRISQALEECGRATELDPNLSEAFHFRAEVLATLNRHREGIALERKASELSPFSRPWALPRALLWAREYDAAMREAKARLASDPYEDGQFWVLSNVYRCKGARKEEVRSLQRMQELFSDTASASAIARDFEGGGYRAVVLGELERSKQKALTQYVSPVILAGFTAELKQREQTLAFLEQGFRERNWGILFIQCDCAYDFLHSDERYRSLIKKIGLPPAY